MRQHYLKCENYERLYHCDIVYRPLVFRTRGLDMCCGIRYNPSCIKRQKEKVNYFFNVRLEIFTNSSNPFTACKWL